MFLYLLLDKMFSVFRDSRR